MTNRRQYIIDSHNATNTDYNVSGMYQIPVPIPSTEDYDSVVVVGASIPKSYYLVQRGENTIILDELGVHTTVEIPEGNYSALSFANIVGTLLTNLSPHHWTYTITLPNPVTQPSTGKFTYTVTGNSGNQPSFIFGSYKINEQFGFDTNSVNSFVNDKLVSQNVLKFQVEDTLVIHSDICNNGNDDILQTIFVAQYGDFSSIKYQATDIELEAKQLRTISSGAYHFSITDEDNNIILLNGLNFVLNILLFKRDNTNKLVKDYIKYKTIK